MKILLESGSPQTLNFIPREYPILVNYTITDEETNTSISDTNISTTINGGYLEITEIFTLKEGVFYNIDITKTDNTLIFRGRIFCTNQNIDTFSMNDGEFVEDTTKDNTYVIYE